MRNLADIKLKIKLSLSTSLEIKLTTLLCYQRGAAHTRVLLPPLNLNSPSLSFWNRRRGARSCVQVTEWLGLVSIGKVTLKIAL